MELHRNSDFVVKGNSVGLGLFPVVMYGCERWTVKKAECRRIDDLLIKIIVHFVSVT